MHRLALLLCALVVAAGLQADERILDYHSEIQVQPDGALHVTETIRVRAEGRAIRRGIYRDFPTRYTDRIGNRVVVDFTPVSVRRDGGSEPWHTERLGNGVRIYAGSANTLIEPGVHVYEFTFVTNRQLGFFDDHDELYFNAIGTGWGFPIDRAEVTVKLPFTLPKGQVEIGSYSGSYGSRGSYASGEILPDGRVYFQSSKPLAPHEGLTVLVSWSKGLL